jgi:predicted nucleic-acid-binding protein
VKALDTNILVRFLVADDPAQSGRVREIFQAAERGREPLFIATTVLLETIWVLGSVYDTPRENILMALGQLARLPFLKFERPQVVRRLVEEGRNSRADLADLLIGLCGAESGCATTLTFDRRLERSPFFEVIGAKRQR